MEMLYFVESTLAGGKTTFASKLANNLRKQDRTPHFYREHEAKNPLDFTLRAYLSSEEYLAFYTKMIPLLRAHYLDDFEYGLERLVSAVEPFEEGFLIHCGDLYFNDLALRNEIENLSAYGLQGGRIKVEKYKTLLAQRFASFFRGIPFDDDYIFEGALLQNPLLDLFAFYQESYTELADYYSELLKDIDRTRIELYFIKVTDKDSMLKKAAVERRSSHIPWIDAYITWVEKSPYGITNKLFGFEGAVKFSEELEKVSLYVASKCDFPIKIIERK